MKKWCKCCNGRKLPKTKSNRLFCLFWVTDLFYKITFMPSCRKEPFIIVVIWFVVNREYVSFWKWIEQNSVDNFGVRLVSFNREQIEDTGYLFVLFKIVENAIVCLYICFVCTPTKHKCFTVFLPSWDFEKDKASQYRICISPNDNNTVSSFNCHGLREPRKRNNCLVFR